jgi:tRNA pseudouridine32 synthase/23S rRNA pseudouridine746 synthase
VLFSVNPKTRNAYQALFRERAVHKVYHAVAAWQPKLPWPIERQTRIGPSAHFMQQQELPGTANAHTHIRPLRIEGDHALYELCPISGQRHQLRVHMAALGLPLEGDGIYPDLLPEDALDYTRPLQLLAHHIAFNDPVIGEPRSFTSQRRLRIGMV